MHKLDSNALNLHRINQPAHAVSDGLHGLISGDHRHHFSAISQPTRALRKTFMTGRWPKQALELNDGSGQPSTPAGPDSLVRQRGKPRCRDDQWSPWLSCPLAEDQTLLVLICCSATIRVFFICCAQSHGGVFNIASSLVDVVINWTTAN